MSQEDDAISLGTPDDVDLYISTYEDDEETNTQIKIQMEERKKKYSYKINYTQQDLTRSYQHGYIHPSIELNTIRQNTWTYISITSLYITSTN